MQNEMEHYILEGKEIKKCNSLMEWAEWFKNSENRIIKQDTINGVFISTIFLGIDHGYNGELILFETMIEKDGNQELTRYCTYDEAVQGHEEEKQKVINNKEDKI